MAQTYNFNGVKLVIPGSYVQTTVINAQNGISANGIVALVGEAESGPAYSSLSKDLSGAFFTPDEFSIVQAKFGAGPLVDAFANMVQPFVEPGLVGGPTRIYVLKTNAGTAASRAFTSDGTTPIATFSAWGDGTYGDNIDVKYELGDADKGMRAINFTFKYDQNSDTGSIKISPALEFIADGANFTVVAGTNTLSIQKGSDPAISFPLEGISLSTLVTKKIASYTGTGGALEGLTVNIATDEYKFQPCIGLMDTGTYIINDTETKYVTTYGYQFAQFDSGIVSVSPSFAKAAAAAWGWAGGGTATEVLLQNGAKGSTTQADIKAALAKIEKQRINFVVPLFSRDSVEVDEISGDPLYTIDEVIKDTLTHVVNASKIKANRNRQACLSFWDASESNSAYTLVKQKVADSAVTINTPFQYRSIMAFQQVQVPNAQGVVPTIPFDPWMLAAISAAAQSVAGYRPIFNKALNVIGVVDPNGFNEQYEDALYNGLMPVRLADDSVNQIIVSDQTTYLTPDNNFVYNSFQAVYGSDVIAMTLQQRMQTFVGQSVADVTAGIALNYLKTVLSELLANKWIAPSSDAPSGYKNAKVSINAPVMNVSVEVKESTGIYFVPINLSISAVSSSAQ
jgi:hypothetical protein